MRQGQGGAGFQRIWSAASLQKTEVTEGKGMQSKECRDILFVFRDRKLVHFLLWKHEYVFCHITKVISFSFNLFQSDDVCQHQLFLISFHAVDKII